MKGFYLFLYSIAHRTLSLSSLDMCLNDVILPYFSCYNTTLEKEEVLVHTRIKNIEDYIHINVDDLHGQEDVRFS